MANLDPGIIIDIVKVGTRSVRVKSKQSIVAVAVPNGNTAAKQVKLTYELVLNFAEVRLKPFDENEVKGQNKLYIPFKNVGSGTILDSTDVNQLRLQFPRSSKTREPNAKMEVLFRGLKVGPGSGSDSLRKKKKVARKK